MPKYPNILSNVERVLVVRLLGIYLMDTLSMSEHVQQSIKVCNQRLYLLCQLKNMGMSCDCLTVVFDAIVLSKLLYASPAWFGFISVEHLNLIQKLLDKS